MRGKWIYIMCWGAFAAAASAQETVAVQENMTLGQIVETGGWPMYLLGVVSILAVSLIVYFFSTFRLKLLVPPPIMSELRSMLAAKRLDEARLACDKNPSAMAEIAGAALDYAERTDNADPGMLKEIIEGEGARQASVLQNKVQYLLDIGGVAPMIGLLGTVIGMLKAFNTVALDIAKVKPMILAAGVSQALITTAAGLMIGIPALIFYAYFRGRVSKLIAGVEKASAELLTLIVEKKEL